MRIVDRLQTVDVEIDQTAGRIIPFGKGHDPRQFADKGTAVGNRRQSVLIGELFEIGDSLTRLFELAPERIDLLHQTHDRALHLGGQFRIRNTEDGRVVGDIARGGGGGGRSRPRIGAGQSGDRCLRLAVGNLHTMTVRRPCRSVYASDPQLTRFFLTND